MKHPILITLLLLTPTLQATHPIPETITWGDTDRQILAKETARFLKQGPLSLMFLDRLAGEPYVKEYYTDADGLYMVMCKFLASETEQLAAYEKLAAHLGEINGTPLPQYADEWKAPELKDRADQRMKALKEGHVTMATGWEPPEGITILQLALIVDEVNLTILILPPDKTD